MLKLPGLIQEQFFDAQWIERSPAYLIIDKNGDLLDWGGNTELYGIEPLRQGERAGTQVYFLQGFIPVRGNPVFLRFVKTGSGASADIYFFSGQTHDCVLMLNATAEETAQAAVQQKANEGSLLREKQKVGANMSTTFLESMFALLDSVVLERTEKGVFRSLGNFPHWFIRIYPDALADRQNLQPQKQLLFLENFMVDAENFWQDRAIGRLKSGPWVEVDSAGNEWTLEASAIFWEGHSILLIEFPRVTFQEKQELVQKGREKTLENRAVTRSRRVLQKSEERYDALLQATRDTVLIIDKDGQVKGELTGLRAPQAFPSELRPQFVERIRKVLKSHEIESLSYDMNGQKCEARFVVSGRDEALVLVRNLNS